MAGEYNMQFMENPQAFLQRYHIRANPQPLPGQELTAGPMEMDLNPVPGTQMVSIVKYLRRERHPDGTSPVNAFFLPAIKDQEVYIGLNSSCRYMFTYDLSGCLFAAFGKNSDAVTAGHFNAFSSGRDAAANLSKRILFITEGNYDFCKVLSPSRWVDTGWADVSVYPSYINTCVIGLRTSGTWEFFYRHSTEDQPDQFFVRKL